MNNIDGGRAVGRIYSVGGGCPGVQGTFGGVSCDRFRYRASTGGGPRLGEIIKKQTSAGVRGWLRIDFLYLWFSTMNEGDASRMKETIQGKSQRRGKISKMGGEGGKERGRQRGDRDQKQIVGAMKGGQVKVGRSPVSEELARLLPGRGVFPVGLYIKD